MKGYGQHWDCLGQEKKAKQIGLDVKGMIREMYSGAVDKKEPEEEIIQVELCELLCLAWGLIALSLEDGNDDINSIARQHTIVLKTLSHCLANNALCILNCARGGFDYQTGILLRTTYEVGMVLLVTLWDDGKCRAYFSNNGADRSKVWKQHFTFSKLNQALEEFENGRKSANENAWQEIRSQRRFMYRYYSGNVHADYLTAYVFCHKRAKRSDDLMPWNLWGAYASRLDKYTEDLFLLLAWVINYFLQSPMPASLKSSW